jgi:ubiquinol-cytochrome c reductase cytochrome b subunit
MAKTGAFFALVFAVLALLGGIAQINPIWLYGPYDPAVVSAGTQPDWYIGFLDGGLRLMPPWETRLFGHTIPTVFWPAVVIPGVMFTLAGLYPFLEPKFMGGDRRLYHNLLERPRDNPTRTALGAMALTFFGILTAAGGNDIAAAKLDLSINFFIWAGRIGLVILPPLAYWVTYKICLGAQQHDREVLVHGVETGIIKRLPTGEFIEVHQPLAELDEHGHPIAIPYAREPLPKKMNKLGYAGRSVKGFFAPLERPAPPVERPAEEDRRELTGAGADD